MFDLEIDKYFRTIAFRQSKYLQDLKHAYPVLTFNLLKEEADKCGRTLKVYKDIPVKYPNLSQLSLSLKSPMLARMNSSLEYLYMMNDDVDLDRVGPVATMYSDLFKREWNGSPRLGLNICIEAILTRTSHGPFSMWTDYEREIQLYTGASKRAFLDAVLKFNLEISGTTTKSIMDYCADDFDRLSLFIQNNLEKYKY
jgi:hypothetical protein